MSSRRRSSSRRSGEPSTVIYIPSSNEDTPADEEAEDSVFTSTRARSATEDLDRMEAGLSPYSVSSDAPSSFELVRETGGTGAAKKPNEKKRSSSRRQPQIAAGAPRGSPATPKAGKSPKVSRPPSVPSLPENGAGGGGDDNSSSGGSSSHTTSNSSRSTSPVAPGEPSAAEGDEFSFCDSDIEDFERECYRVSVADNLGFEPSVVAPQHVEYLKFVLQDFDVQHLRRLNECIPMPAFALTSLVDPVLNNVAPGERDLTRRIITHAVIINYYYVAQKKARHMMEAIRTTVRGDTVRRVAAQVNNQSRSGRAAALALHFLTSRKGVTDGQYATSLRRLDEELRHRGTPESPRLTEVYQTLRDYNVLFYTAHYTSRGALYLYRQNLQRLNENHRGMLRLLSVEEICEEHTLNDLAFLVGVELMITHFQRTIRVLRCYLQHQLQSISELCYLIYVQLPSLREDYAQLSDVLYWAVSQNYDYALYASTPALFDFLRVVRQQDAFICTDYVYCALRLLACPDRPIIGDTGGSSSSQRLVGEFMVRDPLLRDPRATHLRQKLITRDICVARLQAQPSSRHIPVEHTGVSSVTLLKIFSQVPPDEREEDTLREMALKAFMEANGNHPEQICRSPPPPLPPRDYPQRDERDRHRRDRRDSGEYCC